ncbi:MAG: hypothetical protein ABS99_05730 [Acetobacteraceae bacterium SCN 69-10]|nr:MAG: hypothetical protein ABS99_05730 [Acetobacteraceae bacterium SCN 69-10]
MKVLNVIARAGAQLIIAVLGALIFMRPGEPILGNPFMFTFLAASVPAVWWRDVTWWVRPVALVVAGVAAVLVGLVYFVLVAGAAYFPEGTLPHLVGALVGFAGPLAGWLAASRTIRWLGRRRRLRPTPRPLSTITEKEVVMFRFLLLAWGMAALLLIVASFAFLIAIFFNAERSTFDSALELRDLWTEWAGDSALTAFGLFMLPTPIFYATRWALTGRFHPLWLLPPMHSRLSAEAGQESPEPD